MAEASATAKIHARRLEALASALASTDMDLCYCQRSRDGLHIYDTVDEADVELIIDGLRMAARALKEGRAT